MAAFTDTALTTLNVKGNQMFQLGAINSSLTSMWCRNPAASTTAPPPEALPHAGPAQR